MGLIFKCPFSLSSSLTQRENCQQFLIQGTMPSGSTAVSGYCLTGLCSLLPSFLSQTNKLICYLSLWKIEFLNNRKRIYYVLPFKIEFWYHHPSLCVHVLRGQRTTQMSWFSSPSKMWVLGIKLRLPGLEATAFIH